MINLYGLLCIMALIAMTLTAFSLPSISKKTYVLISLFTLLFSFSLYQFIGNKLALSDWLDHGKERYRLLAQFSDLGGVEGAIKRIQQRLAQNPNDKEGWLILGKLYLIDSKPEEAQKAFARASH